MSSPFARHVLVCTQDKPDGVPCCARVGGPALLEALRAEVAAQDLAEEVPVTGCGCLGLCERGPNVVVYPDGYWYTGLAVDEVPRVVTEHLAGNEPVAGRGDPDPETIRSEVAAHRAHVRQVLAARAKAGVLPDELSALLRGFQPSRAVLTAVELDVFTPLGEGASAREVAEIREMDPRATESLLNALVALRLLEKEGDRFRNGEWARTFLCEGAPHDSRAALMHTVHLWPRWSTLTEAVRKGTAVAFKEMTGRGEEWTEAFIAAMHKSAAARAPVVVSALDLAGVDRVLDLGGGSGAYAMAFARARPGLEVTVFDLPTVTPLTRRYVAEGGLQERIHTRDGDLRTDAYGTEYDLVFVSAICHMNGPDENRAMLRRVRQALAPGGRVVIQDFILDPDKTSPTSGALFALNMLVGTREGSAYSDVEYTDWLVGTGFVDVRRVPLPGPTDLMVALRPAD
jgi:(2Fe-2S) ferredoxin/predicted O-methyltransferase YrrM